MSVGYLKPSRAFLFKLIAAAFFVLLFTGFFTHVGSHSHDHHHGHNHDHEHPNEEPSFKYSREANVPHGAPETHHHSSTPVSSTKTSMSDVWLYALGSTAVISIAPFLILFFIPLDNSKEHEPLLKILLAFASGGLLGDAFLHLIPHALIAEQALKSSSGNQDSHGHVHQHHGHSHGDGEAHNHDISVGLWVLSGILMFLFIEKLIRIVKGGHGHSHSPVSKNLIKKTQKKDSEDEDDEQEDDEEPKDIAVAGYLNLAADFAHNLTDGLAIGASFIAGQSIGIVTAITILLHEVPHEIGDFAILIQSGCSRRKAIGLQLITAVGALTGTVISLVAEGVTDAAATWILPFTAGGFIYIATVSVLPELLQGSSFKQSLKEIMALVTGVFLMVLIAKYE